MFGLKDPVAGCAIVFYHHVTLKPVQNKSAEVFVSHATSRVIQNLIYYYFILTECLFSLIVPDAFELNQGVHTLRLRLAYVGIRDRYLGCLKIKENKDITTRRV